MSQITKKLTIEQVVKKDLCTGCGTCSSICPSSAISVNISNNRGIFLPEIDRSKCIGCSLCYAVCPGISVNFKELSMKANIEQTKKPLANLIGNYSNCYVGYSTESSIRFNSSSGGVVSQLLIFALESGIIDGALVTRMRKDKPLEPESFIARTSKEIIAASKSKYCPVSANVALREILECKGRYAVVGLPCHIHGIINAKSVNKKLKERIVFSIGLFCSHNDSFFSTKYLLKRRLGINPDNVAKIDYRGQGWPGVLHIEDKSGKVIECPMRSWIPLHDHCFFAPYRCLVCCDHTAELADISSGDAWLPEYAGDNFGTSIFITRSEIGQRIVESAQLHNKISLKLVDPIKVIRSQGNLRFKKNSYVVRSFLFKINGKQRPQYYTTLPKPAIIDWARSLQILFNRKMISKRFFYQDLERLISWQNRLKKVYMKAISR